MASNKKVSLNIELDMDSIREVFKDENLNTTDIVNMLSKEIKMKNNNGDEIIKVVKATQLLVKPLGKEYEEYKKRRSEWL
tara:strand:+ start:2618 stop:2857 length:240 start_codon:yes stop_codon:yes gene_type:complete